MKHLETLNIAPTNHLNNSGTSTGSSTAGAPNPVKEKMISKKSSDLIDTAEKQIQDVEKICAKFNDLSVEVDDIETQAKETRKKIQTLLASIGEYTTKAADSGFEDIYTNLDNAETKVQKKLEEMDSGLCSMKISRGMKPFEDTTLVSKNLNLKAPVFDGDSKKLNFFEFKAEFETYCKANNIRSTNDKRLKLGNECLQGPAKMLVKRMTDYEKLWLKLKEVYGNYNELYKQKIEQVTALGICPKDPEGRRTWLVEILSLIEQTKNVAEAGNMADDFYNSRELMICLGQQVGSHIYQKFNEKIHNNDDVKSGAGITTKKWLEMWINHLDEMLEAAKIDVIFRQSVSSNFNSGENKVKQDKGHQRSKSYFVAVEATSEEESETDNEEPPKEKVKKKKKKKKKSEEVDPENTIFSNKSSKVEWKDCSLCGHGKRHTLIAYCPVFGKAKVGERYKLCKNTGACVSCLRMDAAFVTNPEAREKWYKEHSPYCSSEWWCKHDDCQKISKEKRQHFLLCRSHVEQNKKTLEADFIKSLDPKVSGKVSFFLAATFLQSNEITDKSGTSKYEMVENLDHLQSKSFFSNKEDVDEQIEGLQHLIKDVNQQLEQETAMIHTGEKTTEGEKITQPFQSHTGEKTFECKKITQPLHDNVKIPEYEDSTNVFASKQSENIPSACIYMVQTYRTKNNEDLLVFYDSGCYGASFSDKAFGVLPSELVRNGPTKLEVAGGMTVLIEHGDYNISLNLINDKQFTVKALRMSEISGNFPFWDLQEAWEDINDHYTRQYPFGEKLPTVDKNIGGTSVDIMLGIRYFALSPTPLFSLPSGLTIFKSRLKSGNGNQGILGGPHESWARAVQQSHLLGARVYFTHEMRAYVTTACTLTSEFSRIGPKHEDLITVETSTWNEDVEVVNDDCYEHHCDLHADKDWKFEGNQMLNMVYTHISTEKKMMEKIDNIGSEVSYRCIKCRSCNDCKKSELLEITSINEEQEQFLIEQSVRYDDENKQVVAKLPFIVLPEHNLFPNKKIAERIFSSQMKLFTKSPEARLDVVKSHQKLVDHKFVCKATDLPQELQDSLEEPGSYFIPWRFVSKPDSLSTPVRMVFDASSTTPGGCSLNEALAKGQKKLSDLFHLLIKFRGNKAAFTCDVSLAYNSIALEKEDLKYQKYLWAENLDPAAQVVTMVVLTCIYGVRPAGNLTIEGFHVVARFVMEKYPELMQGAETLMNSAYMDDIIATFYNIEECKNVAEQLEKTLSFGSMKVKDFTFSGEAPTEKVSKDGETVGVVGYTWFPEADKMSLDIKPLFLGKVKRGKIPELVTGDVKTALGEKFTKRTLVSKCAGVFDPLGLVTPFTAKLKLDLSVITKLKVGWDDALPTEHLDTWVQNLNLIQKLKQVKIPRSVLPTEAADNNMEIIVCVDASQTIACAAAYSRTLLEDGRFGCRLIVAKNKIVNLCSIPRAELRAAAMGAALGHTVQANFGDRVKSIKYVTDSTITMFWIRQDQRPLQVAVRNLVIEIRRLTKLEDWYHVASGDNPADIGTRAEGIEALVDEGDWFTGRPWMKMADEIMPLKSADDLILSQEERREAYKEVRASDIQGIVLSNLIQTKVGERYSFSRYIIDPCKFNWSKFIHLLGTVLKCCKVWKGESSKFQKSPTAGKIEPITTLNDDDIKKAEDYLFKITTLEVKKFQDVKKLKGGPFEEKDGILYYVGRLLEVHTLEDVGSGLIDLKPLTFVKPVLDRYSPVAYSIMIHTHQVVTDHGSVPVTLRESRSLAYCLQGRDLAKEVRDACNHCRRYKSRMLKVEMGKLHESRTTIAPPFYYCQIDLFGPYDAKCEHMRHRSKVKVWGAVMKCPATLAIAAYCMTGYSAEKFLDAYSRFTYDHGHPGKVFIDAGSQLISAFTHSDWTQADLLNGIEVKHGTKVEFEVCPVGGHNYNGCVERGIGSIKKIFREIFDHRDLEIMQYETAFKYICNKLNCLPICVGSRSEDLGFTDLITPARLLHGRNNRKAPVGLVEFDSPSKMLEKMEEVERAWWKIWRDEKIIDYIPKTNKWLDSDAPIEVGDVVIFIPHDGDDKITKNVAWKYGRILKVYPDSKGLVRRCTIEYKNAGESVTRTTERATRGLAVLHREDDLDMLQQLNEAAKAAQIHFYKMKN